MIQINFAFITNIGSSFTTIFKNFFNIYSMSNNMLRISYFSWNIILFFYFNFFIFLYWSNIYLIIISLNSIIFVSFPYLWSQLILELINTTSMPKYQNKIHFYTISLLLSLLSPFLNIDRIHSHHDFLYYINHSIYQEKFYNWKK